MTYDALLLVSFGGPEGPDDVLPFLRNVTRGRGIPDERLSEVAEHYYHFGGVSPINAQVRALIAALRGELSAHTIHLPVYWGNRNWPPMLVEALQRMRADGIKRALAFVTSAYGSYSSCRQYLEDIAAARAAVGVDAPIVDKIRHYFDHPGFITPFVEGVQAALPSMPANTRLVFTSHSIPNSMNDVSGPSGARYTDQHAEVARLVAEAAAPHLGWDLVWQSRSGPPEARWLEPDVNDHLKVLADQGVEGVIVVPVGFTSDHLEVIWDLDNEAAKTAENLGMAFSRVATPGTHPAFVSMVRELITERTQGVPARHLGKVPTFDSTPEGCCPARRPPIPPR
ncbi:ferrochelatase [Actinorhabdospora filicis]|uniref:Coproporphyrin III ferrochelatase n=1 Tax=Actinorhabdospora filicis TaxID=1785913 RepID=A0A9W6SMX0_9ACTN|nr:ferrochelatase [Actinorhabdospora filicis]GLZ78774.1 ferrochelatase [Actinorhabdospora filicis]